MGTIPYAAVLVRSLTPASGAGLSHPGCSEVVRVNLHGSSGVSLDEAARALSERVFFGEVSYIKFLFVRMMTPFGRSGVQVSVDESEYFICIVPVLGK
jgi:hypothetical protein